MVRSSGAFPKRASNYRSDGVDERFGRDHDGPR